LREILKTRRQKGPLVCERSVTYVSPLLSWRGKPDVGFHVFFPEQDGHATELGKAGKLALTRAGTIRSAR